ncbi:hypothetical protein OC835_007998 [Tilletia horrida]|nr:hypothetical protein OC835_007998 [Tilletia horrida]
MRILLNSDGTSRGVGFVRLRDREVAQDCIDRLHGRMLPGCASPLQVRFADSEGQKLLKRNAMMQNSINALNAQARDVLRSSNPLAALDGGRGPGSVMSDLGMPSPSASPFPLSMPAVTAATMASSSPGMYLPYSPTPSMHAQAAHLLNPVTAGAAELPTPGPSPGDSNAATMAAILAASAAAQQRQAGGLMSGAGTASAYNLSPSPLTAAGTLYGGAGTTTSSLLPSGMMGLASPIPGSLSLSRPLSTSNTSTATSTMPMPVPMVTYAPTTAGATTSMPEFATFSPPLLNISLGGTPTQHGHAQYHHQHQGQSNALHGGSSLLLASSSGAAGSAVSASSAITAPYSSFQLQQILGSSAHPSPAGLVSAVAHTDGLVRSFDEQRNDAHARQGSGGSGSSGGKKA